MVLVFMPTQSPTFLFNDFDNVSVFIDIGNFQIEKLPDHGTLPTLMKRHYSVLFLKSIVILRGNIRMSGWNRMGSNCDFRPLSVRRMTVIPRFD